MPVARLRLVVDAPPLTERAPARAPSSPRPKRPDGPTPTPVQRTWLMGGLDQPGGKLPLFDAEGQRVHPRTVKRCVEAGWAEPWFANPVKPDWLVCKLTDAGRRIFDSK